MAAESTPPPPSQGGGFAKYLIALLLLGGGGLGVYLASSSSTPAPPPPPAPPVKNAQRSTALADNTMEIPDEVPDAGPQQPVVEPQKKPRAAGPGPDPWECSGDIAPKEISKVIAESQLAIIRCYERRLRVDNGLQGSLQLKVRVGNNGAVSMTQVRGSLNDKEVRECVSTIAKKWSFPAPEGGNCAVFDAPYNFMPKN
jgi:hypothetical protein